MWFRCSHLGCWIGLRLIALAEADGQARVLGKAIVGERQLAEQECRAAVGFEPTGVAAAGAQAKAWIIGRGALRWDHGVGNHGVRIAKQPDGLGCSHSTDVDPPIYFVFGRDSGGTSPAIR